MWLEAKLVEIGMLGSNRNYKVCFMDIFILFWRLTRRFCRFLSVSIWEDYVKEFGLRLLSAR